MDLLRADESPLSKFPFFILFFIALLIGFFALTSPTPEAATVYLDGVEYHNGDNYDWGNITYHTSKTVLVSWTGNCSVSLNTPYHPALIVTFPANNTATQNSTLSLSAIGEPQTFSLPLHFTFTP